MAAWLQMRQAGGRILLRIEDLDHPKHKPGADATLIDDLRWLGFDWDGPIVRQSTRLPAYRAALARLARTRLIDHSLASADVFAVQRFDGLARFGVVRHLHKPESLGAAGLAVADDAGCRNLTVRFKDFPQSVAIEIVGQVSNVDVHPRQFLSFFRFFRNMLICGILPELLIL